MTPGQLVQAMSIALNTPLETVTQHDRNLAVAGLRTTGARGRNAPHVTTLDAARLLAAILGSIRTMDSVVTVKGLESAVLHRQGDAEPEQGSTDVLVFVDERRRKEPAQDLSAIADLPRQHSFIEALDALIKFAIALPSEDEAARLSYAHILCSMPWGTASIFIPGAEEQLRYGPGKKQLEIENMGIEQIRTIYGYVLLVIGLAFLENGLNYPTAKKATDAFLARYSGPAKPKKNKGACWRT